MSNAAIMAPARRERLTEEEYLARELRGVERHEFVNGEMIAMAGGTPRHSLIGTNVASALRDRLMGRCLVFNSDLRIHVPSTGLYTYPDVSVVCGSVELHPKDRATLVNPSVIVEVLSPETEAYDRGAKFAHYRSIQSLRAYLLVSLADRRLDHYRRGEAGEWVLTEFVDEQTATLSTVGIELPLAELYRGVDQLPELS